MQRSALCRSRRELSNEYLLAKIGVDTAENEPLEVWGENSIQYSIVSLQVTRQYQAIVNRLKKEPSGDQKVLPRHVKIHFAALIIIFQDLQDLMRFADFCIDPSPKHWQTVFFTL